ncbi:5439_t:CDS:2, partial [Racocetra persica]
MPVVSPSFIEDVEDLLVEDVEENPFVDSDNELATKELQQEEKIDTYQQFSDEDFIQTAIEVEQ